MESGEWRLEAEENYAHPFVLVCANANTRSSAICVVCTETGGRTDYERNEYQWLYYLMKT